MKNKITKDFGVTNAHFFEQAISYPLANVYIMLGRATAFDGGSVEQPYDTTEYKNDMLRHGIVMKRLTSSDVQAVVPRVDWAAGTKYYAYYHTANLFSTTLETVIVPNVDVSLSSANTVTPNSGVFTLDGNLIAGNRIKIGEEVKEITFTSNTSIKVNSSFSSAYTNSQSYLIRSASSGYYNPFYVRNKYDQVFKCLSNNSGTMSNTEPMISLGGQLPENAYIETDDGYKWKYLYTIPNGLKNKFFNSKYMPVLRDATIYNNSVDGRIDIININNPGSRYYNASNVTNYPIITVTGDGTGANVTADIVNGQIADINILDGGSGYSYATVTVNDVLQQANGTAASLDAVISPEYGHGYDAVRELGASTLMLSVDFSGSVSGYYPIASDGTDDYRQISIVKNPKYRIAASNGTYSSGFASNSLYSMFTTIYVQKKDSAQFVHDSTVYVGESLATATFSGTLIHYDAINAIAYVNNITGDDSNLTAQQLKQENNSAATTKIFSVVKSPINNKSGEILYIENRSAIVRNQTQTETVKLVLDF